MIEVKKYKMISLERLKELERDGTLTVEASDSGEFLRIEHKDGWRTTMRSADVRDFGQEVVFVDTTKDVINTYDLLSFPMLYEEILD